MTKGGRVAVAVGIVLLTLGIVLAVLAMVLVTPERARDYLVPLVHERTGRTLAFDNLDVSLLSGIRIDNVRLTDQVGNRVLGAESVQLRYRFWPLLFGRVLVDRVEMKGPSLRLERLFNGRLLLPWDAPLEPAEPGKKNVTQAKTSAPMTVGKASKGATFIDLAVRRLLIEDGLVELYDRAIDPKAPYLVRLEQVRLAAEDLALDRAFPVDLTVRFNGAAISLKGQVDPAGNDHDLALTSDEVDLAPLLPYLRPHVPGTLSGAHIKTRLTLKGKGDSWLLKGGVRLDQLGLRLDALPDTPVRDGTLSLNLDAAWQTISDRLELRSSRLDYNGLALMLTGSVNHPAGDARGQVHVRLVDFDLHRLPELLPGSLADSLRPLDPGGQLNLTAELDGALMQPFEAVRSVAVDLKQVRFNIGQARWGIDGRLTGDLDRLKGRDLKISLGEQEAHLDLTMTKLLGTPLAVNALARADILDIDALVPKAVVAVPAPKGGTAARTGKVKGGRSGKPPTSGRKPVGFPVEGQFEVRIGQLTSRSVAVGDVHALGQLKSGVLTVDPVTGRLGQGRFVKTLRCDLNRDRPTWQSTVKFEVLPLDKLLALTVPKMQGSARGLVNGHFALNGQGFSNEQIRTGLGGEGRIELAQAVISGTKLSQGLVGLLGMGQLNNIDIEQGVLNFALKKGIANLDGVLSGQDMRLEPAGVVDLRGPVKVRLPLWLAPRLAGGLALKGVPGALLKDDAGWTLVPLKVAGRIDDPSIRLDDKVLKRRVRRAGKETLKKKLMEKIAPNGSNTPAGPEKQLLEDVLKNLLGQ